MTNTEKRNHIIEQVNLAILALSEEGHNPYLNAYVLLHVADIHYKVRNNQTSLETFKQLVLGCPGFKEARRPRGPRGPQKIRPLKREVFERRYANDSEVTYAFDS